MPWTSVTAGSQSWTTQTATTKAYRLVTVSQMPWVFPRPAEAQADTEQDFRFAFRERGALTLTESRPFHLTDSTLSEGLP